MHLNLFGRKPQRQHANNKEQQLTELRNAFPSFRRVNENSVEIVFSVNGVFQKLDIYLNDDFPTSKPILVVVGEIKHSILDDYKRVVHVDKVT